MIKPAAFLSSLSQCVRTNQAVHVVVILYINVISSKMIDMLTDFSIHLVQKTNEKRERNTKREIERDNIWRKKRSTGR